MPTLVLHSTGDVVPGSSNVTVVGSAPQWGDGSDATYTAQDTRFVHAGGAFAASAIETLVLPVGATYSGMRARVRCSSDGNADLVFQAGSRHVSDFISYFTTNTADPSDPDCHLITDGEIHDYDLIQSTHEIDGDVLATLLAGAWVGGSGTAFGLLTIYEFTVYVDYTAPVVVIPADQAYDPLRQIPRGSPTRQIPNDRSYQARNRGAGGYR